MTVGERIELFKVNMPFITEDVVNRLSDNGFFVAPASANHHGNYEGGLFDHSLEVAKTLQELTWANRLTWKRHNSPWIIGMFHDICKMDSYKRIIDKYEYNEDTLYRGHGDKSVIVLSPLIDLTPEEVACIRYHMGAFTDRGDWKYYTNAIHEFPNVLWTHHADMIASHIKGV